MSSREQQERSTAQRSRDAQGRPRRTISSAGSLLGGAAGTPASTSAAAAADLSSCSDAPPAAAARASPTSASAPHASSATSGGGAQSAALPPGSSPEGMLDNIILGAADWIRRRGDEAQRGSGPLQVARRKAMTSTGGGDCCVCVRMKLGAAMQSVASNALDAAGDGFLGFWPSKCRATPAGSSFG